MCFFERNCTNHFVFSHGWRKANIISWMLTTQEIKRKYLLNWKFKGQEMQPWNFPIIWNMRHEKSWIALSILHTRSHTVLYQFKMPFEEDAPHFLILGSFLILEIGRREKGWPLVPLANLHSRFSITDIDWTQWAIFP